jgi:phosphoheptose isomerase
MRAPAEVRPSELDSHLEQLIDALRSPLTRLGTARDWGRRLATPLLAGNRLLVAGNGGSAAEAQHLTAELVGRYVDDRPPLSAIARQVAAHGRPGDVVLLLSASGRSPNVLAAAERARALGLTVWAMTGPAPNPLAALADDAICVAGAGTSVIQEVHLIAIHALCEALDARISEVTRS